MIESKFARCGDELSEAPNAPNRDNATGTSQDALASDQSATKPDKTPAARPDNTDLERRLLAHERILQSLIAHMAETEPKFLERLSDTFCMPVQMARQEHDYTDTDSYAEQFIRTVIGLAKKPAKKSSKPVKGHQLEYLAPSHDTWFRPPSVTPRSFQINHESGVWKVTKNGYFFGNYSKEEDARAAIEVGERRRATVQPAVHGSRFSR